MANTSKPSEPIAPIQDQNLSVTLKENRSFPPPEDFRSKANVSPTSWPEAVKFGAENPEAYWAKSAESLHWFKKWDRVLDWKPPQARWFVGGKINASYNCLDRHLPANAKKAAIIWEGEPGEQVTWTYADLHAETVALTAVLRKLGLKSGDRIAIYMPMIPEAAVAMLACARGGFTHTVIFGGFSSEALKDRIRDAEAKIVITADFGYRKGAKVGLVEQVNKAVAECPSVQKVIVAARDQAGKFSEENSVGDAENSSKHLDWANLLSSVSKSDRDQKGHAEEVDSEHPLFILYTSGTTGKPKGIVHSTGGYLTGVLQTSKDVFDLKSTDLYWCTADIGWVTGHSYVIYGPLAAGASIFMYEGAPTTPKADRFWDMIERHRISILYTAPTAIRAFMRLGTDHPKAHDLSSLRLLGSVGEPINPVAWMWYRETIGGNRCPIVDTYWQTETGAIVVSPLPGVVATKPGSATLPLPGYDVDVVDKHGQSVPKGTGGYLVIRKPWPSMARTIHKDPERFKKTYFSEFPQHGHGIYFTGDGARKDEDGYIWCLGRVDDVLNVSGHRLGTMEIESALVSHPQVAEAAVVGRPDELKGQAVVAFVTLKADAAAFLGKDEVKLAAIKKELKIHVGNEIGALARPDDLILTDALPKTRSGKIMRRLLRELAAGGQVKGDTTTLEDLSVLASLTLGSPSHEED
ncbi:MAG: acetate--CoA ligase [Methylotenera sp.]|nr:acetate--CoA ligase [Oligoflexia bacterium]